MNRPEPNRESLIVAAALLVALGCGMVVIDPGEVAVGWPHLVALALAVAAAVVFAVSRRSAPALLAVGMMTAGVAILSVAGAHRLVAAASDRGAPPVAVEHWQAATVWGLLALVIVLCGTVDHRYGAAAALPLIAAPLAVGLVAGGDTAQLSHPAIRSALWIAAGWGTGAALSHSVRRSRHGALRRGQLGRYVLEDKVGGGGMGEVHRARHMALDRVAAVKIVRAERPAGSSTTATSPTELLAREAVVTAALRSPHTVELYDYGVADDGTLYYVMEYLDGLNVRQLIERFGPQPPGRVVHILLQVCESLREAHDAELVHRDIKPANILLCRLASSADFIKVLDFGLTRSTREVDNGDGATGTPAYMAPELATARDAVDGRSDIYSLGCVAYWMLTGETVFDADDVAEAVVQHVQDEPVAPSERSELDVPADLEAVVMRCLAKQPEDRFEDVQTLTQRLEQCACASTWSAEDADAWWDLHYPREGREAEVAGKLAEVDETAAMISGT